MWGNWSEWTSCSALCGGGNHSRARECNNPPPSNGGLYCVGNQAEIASCNNQPCQYGKSANLQIHCIFEKKIQCNQLNNFNY